VILPVTPQFMAPSHSCGLGPSRRGARYGRRDLSVR
jgi:hypothetical protein